MVRCTRFTASAASPRMSAVTGTGRPHFFESSALRSSTLEGRAVATDAPGDLLSQVEGRSDQFR